MEKTKEEFVVFMREAMTDCDSEAYRELYNFLVRCFVRADEGLEGRVYQDRFDALVEEASKPPRKHGFLPTTDYLYASSELRLEARGEVFQDIDVKHTGYVRLDQWLRYALEHIASKMDLLSKDYFSNASVAGNINRQESPEFEFVELAIDKYSAEHRTLYLLLLKTFKAGDTEKTGQVDPLALDRMIEVLVATLRSSGMGPTTTVMFKDDDERLAKHKEHFRQMDTAGNGSISFDEWLDYAYNHLVRVAAT